MVKLLLKRDANIAGRTRAGWGVLSNAVREGHSEVTKVLADLHQPRNGLAILTSPRTPIAEDQVFADP